MIAGNHEKILLTCREAGAVMSIAQMLWGLTVRGGPLAVWIGRAARNSVGVLGSWVSRRRTAIAAGVSSSRPATGGARIDETKRFQLVIKIDIHRHIASETRVVVRFQVRQSSEPHGSGRSFS